MPPFLSVYGADAKEKALSQQHWDHLGGRNAEPQALPGFYDSGQAGHTFLCEKHMVV